MKTVIAVMSVVGLLTFAAVKAGELLAYIVARPAPVVVMSPSQIPETTVTFRKGLGGGDIVEFTTGRCWTVVNARKKTFYQSCSDLGSPQ